MVHVMVYVAQRYTVAKTLSVSRFQRIDGIWVHVLTAQPAGTPQLYDLRPLSDPLEAAK